MQRVPNYVIVIGLFASAILGAYGKPMIGICAATITLIVKLLQHLAKQTSAKKQAAETHTLARMLHQGGLGNFYLESMLTDIQQTGRAQNTLERFEKATDLDPNDEIALYGVATAYALDISGRTAHGEAVNADRMRAAKRFCRRGRKLYPENPGFLEILGVLADSENNHEIAQRWFRKAGSIAKQQDFSWRLGLATSLAMVGDHESELQTLNEAAQAGADVWVIDFYRGRALCSLGQYADAIPHLKSAFRKRGYHPEIAQWLRIARVCQCHLFRAAWHQLAFNVVLFNTEPLNAFRAVPFTILFTFIVCYCQMKRATFHILAMTSLRRPLLYELLSPESIEVEQSYHFCTDGRFRAAEGVCRQGLKSFPDSIKLRSNLAMALAQQRRRQEAIAELDEALLLAPDNRILLWNRHQILTQETLRVRAAGPIDRVPELKN